MPIHANRIVHGTDPEDPADYYPFEDIRGRLQPKAEKLEVTIRPGHAGETIRKTGIRATPSQIVTVHYVLNWTAAKAALVDYHTLIDGNPYEIIQHSLSYGYFRVLDITEVDVRAVENVIGSILFEESGSVPTVLQTLAWTVVSTEAPA